MHGHILPYFGPTQNTKNSVLYYLIEAWILLHELDVIRYDGATNIGWKTDVFAQLKKKLNDNYSGYAGRLMRYIAINCRPDICLDDKMSRSKIFNILKSLHFRKCLKCLVVNFDNVEHKISKIDRQLICKDQQ